MAKLKTRDLRGKKREDLNKQLEEQKTELASLRVSKVTGGAASKLSKIRTVRKNIARVLTVYNQTQKSELRKLYQGKKYKPLDLRYRKTHMAKLKTKDLRGKKREDLNKQLEEQKTELASLRVSKVTGGAASKLSKIRTVRKNIARVLTVYNQTQKSELRKLYQGKKYKPLDLRYRKTRAQRRALTKHELSLKTDKQKARQQAFPTRKYAVKA
ncbi:unnamed protein product, partial [Mesorhabditis belari]|uniref:Large ribosomal subunit protein uL29 n=1 Tax=Mesorhabditis belari TaxID=2138241 RepID=A0AAF3EG29_9BILA